MGDPRPRHRPSTLLAVVLALGLLAAGCCRPGGPGHGPRDRAGTFTVLTYNVAGLPQEISKVHPQTNIPKISPLLNAYDVVLTQEDFDWWLPGGLAAGLDFTQYHQRLRAATDHPYATPVHPGPAAAGLDLATRPELLIGDGIGMLSRFPLEAFDQRAWTGCFGGIDTSDGGAADCLAMKGFRVATMRVGGAPVDVYSFHGEAGGSLTDQALQADDYAQLAAFIIEHSRGRAVVIGGDTNLHITRGPGDDDAADAQIWADLLAATGLRDVCDLTACRNPAIIDKVAIRSSRQLTLTAEAHAIPADRFTDEAGQPLSDHSPVVATIGWARPGAHRGSGRA